MPKVCKQYLTSIGVKFFYKWSRNCETLLVQNFCKQGESLVLKLFRSSNRRFLHDSVSPKGLRRRATLTLDLELRNYNFVIEIIVIEIICVERVLGRKKSPKMSLIFLDGKIPLKIRYGISDLLNRLSRKTSNLRNRAWKILTKIMKLRWNQRESLR